MKKRTIKKGASNLEIILSFVIFVGFIFFLFLAFPLNRTQTSTVGLDSAERAIMNFTNIDLVYFSAVFSDESMAQNEKTCFSFQPGRILDKVIALDENDNRVNAMSDGESINVEGNGRFFQFYSSNEFVENSFNEDCTQMNSSDYGIGLVREYSVLSGSRIELLKGMYDKDYLNLVINFSLPSKSNFGFTLREINGTEIMNATRKKPVRGNVLARDLPVQIVYSDGELKYAMMRIETW
jgi:hypothetical protein